MMKETMIRKNRGLFLCLVAVFILFNLFMSMPWEMISTAIMAEAAEEKMADQYDRSLLKTAHEASIEEIFASDEVQVVLERDYNENWGESKLDSLLSKIGDVKISDTETLFDGGQIEDKEWTKFRRIISLKLQDSTKETVLDVVN